MTVGVDIKLWPDALKARMPQDLENAAAALKNIKAKTCAGGEFTGWFDWPMRSGRDLLQAIETKLKPIRGSFDLVVVIGIGGSYLGTRAVSEALTHSFQTAMPPTGRLAPYVPVVFVGHTLSEGQFADVLDLLDGHEPIVNVVSKTGTTTEPAVAFRFIRNYLEKRYGATAAAKRIICTTDVKSGALRRMADERGYTSFPVPDDVGGRYSVLTAVGLVPLALAGYDAAALLAGADQVFASLRHDGVATDHVVLRYAAARFAAYQSGKRIELLSFNEPKLGSFAEWWRQLFGESEGKNHQGLFPAPLLFTTDLHSLGQYVQDGRRELIETFLHVGDKTPAWRHGQRLRVPPAGSDIDELDYIQSREVDEINDVAKTATLMAHADGGVPVLQLTVTRLDETTLGGLFAFFESACAVSALMLGVNPFDQPGVEQYKRNLFALLGRVGYEKLAAILRSRL